MGRYGWVNRDGTRTVMSGASETKAHCAAPCPWSVDLQYGERAVRNVRLRARRHSAKTGHQIFFYVERVYILGPEPNVN